MSAESVDIIIVMNMVRFEENILVIVAVELLNGNRLIYWVDSRLLDLGLTKLLYVSTLIPDASSRTACLGG